MGKPHCLLYRVHKQEGNAIRIKGGKHNPRLIRYHAVHIRIIPGTQNSFSPVLPGYMADIGGMRLIGKNKIFHTTAQRLRDPAVIFIHIFLPVPSGIAYVHGPQIPFAHAAQPCTHQMPYHTCFFYFRKEQKLCAAFYCLRHHRHRPVLSPNCRHIFQTGHLPFRRRQRSGPFPDIKAAFNMA